MKPGDRAHNQAHYEALGEVNKNLELSVYVFANIQFAQVITDEVYNILETEGGLERREVVLEDGRKERLRSFVFASPGFQEKERLQVEKLQSSPIITALFQVLIHGSGVVRAGQWTRKLIMNEDLDHGSVLPFLRFNLVPISISISIHCIYILSQGGEGERLGGYCDEHKPERH